MSTTTTLTTIDIHKLSAVTGGCHNKGQPTVINNNNTVQAPAAPAPAVAPVAPQVVQEKRPVSVAIDCQQ